MPLNLKAVILFPYEQRITTRHGYLNLKPQHPNSIRTFFQFFTHTHTDTDTFPNCYFPPLLRSPSLFLQVLAPFLSSNLSFYIFAKMEYLSYMTFEATGIRGTERQTRTHTISMFTPKSASNMEDKEEEKREQRQWRNQNVTPSWEGKEVVWRISTISLNHLVCMWLLRGVLWQVIRL